MLHPTTRSKLREIDNDYGAVERSYAAQTGRALTGDPFAADPVSTAKPPSVTVVIPAFNAAETIGPCLRAIEASTFHERHPHLLQVVVVDDGSADDTAKRAAALQGVTNSKVVSQPHAGRASAMNTGIAAAEGDVVISCDADMLLTRHTIEALTMRHQVLDGVLLLGFRSDVCLGPNYGEEAGSGFEQLLTRPALLGDNRLSFDWPGWPENMVQSSDELRSLGRAQCLWMPSGEAWRLPRVVFGCLFSMRRASLLELGCYDERFNGWGWEDTELAARALAAGHYVIPVYAASGHHIAHRARSPFRWREADRNRRLYQQLLDQPTPVGDRSTPPRLLRPGGAAAELADVDGGGGEVAEWQSASATDAIFTGRTLAAIGRTDDALRILDLVAHSTGAVDAWFSAGVVRFAAGQIDSALESLRLAASHTGRCSIPVATQIGLAEAAAGRFDVARQVLGQALEVEPRDRLLRYVLKCPAYRHRRRGQRYATDGRHGLAVRDFEAALVQDPGDGRARAGREASLGELAP